MEGPEGLLGTTDPTQSGCQQGRQGKCFSLCVRTAHELEIKENTKTFRAVLLFFFFIFGGCSESDEYEIHRCCVMCAVVCSELLRRICEGVCSGKGD